jgi:hypothetical protein
MPTNAESLAQRERAEKERNDREARVRRAARHNVMRRAVRGGGSNHPTASKTARVVTLDDGVEQHASGNAIVVTIRDNSAGRRDLRRHCEREGITTTPLTGNKTVVRDADTVESLTAFGVRRRAVTVYAPWQDGTYNRQTGEEVPPDRRRCDDGGGDTPRAEYLCVGEYAALRTLLHHAAVLSWRWNEAHHVPFASAGSGPEKQRPPSGSVFPTAKPRGTQAQLDKQAAEMLRSARNAGVVVAGA